MTNELRKARRELGRLERQQAICILAGKHVCVPSLRVECASMICDLSVQIKRQGLECCRWEMAARGWAFETNQLNENIRASCDKKCRDFRTLRGAVLWAERQNRKAGGK